MGGRTLSKPSTRIDKSMYDIICEKVKCALAIAIPDHQNVRYQPIPHYIEKDTFGDLDILIEITEIIYLDKLKDLLNIKEVNINGSVVSLGLPIKDDQLFQIDLVKINSESYDFALRYFAYNDLGNLLGRVAKQFGLKLGFKGLFYSYGPLSNKQDILVTKDFNEALLILDYNPFVYNDLFTNGFKDLKSIFDFVISSKYCHKKLFCLDSRSNKERSRDSKRPTYMAFLDYMQKANIFLNKSENPHIPADPPMYMLQTLLNNSLLFTREYHLYCKNYHLSKANKVYFNGTFVSKVLGIEFHHLYLGKLMSKIKSQVPEDYFLTASEKAIRELIIDCHKQSIDEWVNNATIK